MKLDDREVATVLAGLRLLQNPRTFVPSQIAPRLTANTLRSATPLHSKRHRRSMTARRRASIPSIR